MTILLSFLASRWRHSSLETCAGTHSTHSCSHSHPIPHGNFISLTLPSLAKFLPSPAPHPPGYSHFPPHSLTHCSLSPFTHVNKKFDLQLLICMVINKSAKVKTDKCNNILSKIENSKCRTCHRMHCQETANCQLSRQKVVCGVLPGFVPHARTISLKVCWSPAVGSRFFLPLYRGIFGN